ncbi:MAG: DinB family protein [Planctomyces sp.]|nr:DinB family protein [Planctomyces sp.]
MLRRMLIGDKHVDPTQPAFQRTGMDLLDRLLGHDSWTTGRLLDLAASLGDDQFDQEFDIGHRTVRRTFEHILWNVECWTDLMRSQPVRPRPASNPSLAMLRERHATASSELFQLARDIVDQHRLDETFLDTLDDPPRAKSLGGVIVHLATHGMHHRAQLLFMLRRLGVENLPEGDALSWESSLRSP